VRWAFTTTGLTTKRAYPWIDSGSLFIRLPAHCRRQPAGLVARTDLGDGVLRSSAPAAGRSNRAGPSCHLRQRALGPSGSAGIHISPCPGEACRAVRRVRGRERNGTRSSFEDAGARARTREGGLYMKDLTIISKERRLRGVSCVVHVQYLMFRLPMESFLPAFRERSLPLLFHQYLFSRFYPLHPAFVYSSSNPFSWFPSIGKFFPGSVFAPFGPHRFVDAAGLGGRATEGQRCFAMRVRNARGLRCLGGMSMGCTDGRPWCA